MNVCITETFTVSRVDEANRAETALKLLSFGQKGILQTSTDRLLIWFTIFLITPDSGMMQRYHPRFGDIIEIRSPDRLGIKYDANGHFIGFLEP